MAFEKVKNRVEENPRKENPKAGMESAKMGKKLYGGIRSAQNPKGEGKKGTKGKRQKDG